MEKFCAVSIVIPMYNAEKYIGALLDSILAQTFTDFEVVVVDDCSTDSSCAVVESYVSKFDGRLRLSRMKKNSGGAGAPTNKGIAHARGKYIYQVDNDDLLTPTALEILYIAAENYRADVVHTTAYYVFTDEPSNPNPAPEKLTLKPSQLTKSTFDSENAGERLKFFCRNGTPVEGWKKFVRRDLLVENDIKFQEDIKASQDVNWSIELVFYAKHYLRIPNAVYIRRHRSDSVSQTRREGIASIEWRGHLLVKSVEFLCRFFRHEKFFSKNPQYAWLILDWIERRYSTNFGRALLKIPPHDAQKVLSEFFAADFSEHADLIAYLSTSVNASRLKIKWLNERVAELERQLKAVRDNNAAQ